MIVLSCGHSVENIYDSYIVAIKDKAYDYFEHKVYPTVTPMEVCRDCYDNYIDADLILPTREDEENYLLGGGWKKFNKGFIAGVNSSCLALERMHSQAKSQHNFYLLAQKAVKGITYAPPVS